MVGCLMNTCHFQTECGARATAVFPRAGGGGGGGGHHLLNTSPPSTDRGTVPIVAAMDGGASRRGRRHDGAQRALARGCALSRGA